MSAVRNILSPAAAPRSAGDSKRRQVPVDAITIDPTVQRKEGADQRRVNKIAANFNPDALGVMVLSERKDGSLVCLDGMHRLTAAKQAGYRAPLDAIVHTGLSIAQEASLFLLYNDKKDPSAISRFHARILAGDPVAVDMDRIIREHGWKVRQAGEPGNLSAIEKAESVYRNGSGTLPDGAHPEHLSNVLTIITAAWEHDPKSVNLSILAGVSQLLGRFGKSVDFKKLIDEMSGTRPTVLIGKARSLADVQGGTVPAAVAKILVSMHNNRRRTNLLPEWVWVR